MADENKHGIEARQIATFDTREAYPMWAQRMQFHMSSKDGLYEKITAEGACPIFPNGITAAPTACAVRIEAADACEGDDAHSEEGDPLVPHEAP